MQINLAEILKQKKITVSTLAKQTGIGRTTLSQLNNSNKLPEKTKIKTIMVICHALNIPVTRLLTMNTFSYKVADYLPLTSKFDSGIAVINTSDDTSSSYCFAFCMVHKTFPFKIEFQLNEELDKVYKHYATMLNKKGEQIEDPTGENLGIFFSKLQEKYPDDSAKMAQRENEVRDYFYANYSDQLRISRLDISVIDKEELDYLKKHRGSLFLKLKKYDPRNNLIFQQNVKNSELSQISLEIEKHISQISSSHLSSPQFYWELGTDIYGNFRTTVFTQKNNQILNLRNEVRNSINSPIISFIKELNVLSENYKYDC